MANIKISALPSVQPSGYTNDDLLVIVNYDVSSGTTKNTPLTGLTSYVLSGLTFPTDYLPLSGGTVTGDTIFSSGLTATTISASTYLGLPLDVYVTGGTYSAGTITFTNNSGGTFPVSGLTFTGNTSGDCITDLYVTNLNSCSPLHIQPTNSGDVLIGENGGVNVGIGTSTPTEKLEVSGKTKTTTLQVTSGATPGYVLTATDTDGNMSWQSSIKKYSTTLTSPTTGNYMITHNLGTTDISVTLWLVTTDEMTNANINTRTTNSVTVSFLSDVGEDVRVVVIG